MKNTSSFWELRTRRLFFIAVLSLPLLTTAQEKRIDGKIENAKDVEGVHVLNTTSRFNSITNSLGEFYITVKPNDTLLVSSISYVPKQIVISKEMYDIGFLSITLEDLVNELDEVFLGPNLTGDLERDLKKIKVEDQINFDDVGIPGFKGKPEEKIVPAYSFRAPLAVDVEAIYKHLSGYYRKLRLKRKWEGEHIVVSNMIYGYSASFFLEAYGIPENRLYDFLLYCVETTQIKKYYENESFELVFEIFEKESVIYLKRIQEKKE